jgi:acyl dehydratase
MSGANLRRAPSGEREDALNDIEWIDPYEGFVYQEDTITIATDVQHDALSACGIDPALYDGKADPSFFISEAIRAGVRSGITSDGNVNMLQSLVQHRPVVLDEPLRVQGRITAVQAVARGRTIDTDVWFEGADGARAITAKRRTLKPDPAKANERGAGERPAPVVENPSTLDSIGEYALTPDSVLAYSADGNSIHFDPVAAKKAGFRAPIIGGGMGVHYLMAAIWGRPGGGSEPAELDLDIYFRRPVFWDDAFSVRVDTDWRAICLEKGGKVLTEARLNRVG